MSARDRSITRGLLKWFAAHRRELPWRVPMEGSDRRDAYRVLVSEVMLQQTQVSRVVGKYEEFLRRFPDVRALARAGEQEVLSAWTGLGYYRRAKLLHACARELSTHHGGVIPRSMQELRSLPGVGAYTAGAVASLAFGAREAAVDANVTRVLLRIEGKSLARSSNLAEQWAWDRSRTLLRHVRGSAGCWNEALMELGATVCKPRTPECERCPLRAHCVGYAKGIAANIPAPKVAKGRNAITHICVVARDRSGRVLLERRPDTGLWAGMWQTPTIEIKGKPPRRLGLADAAIRLGVDAAELVMREQFLFKTTHREVWFVVLECQGIADAVRSGKNGRKWISRDALKKLALSSPQRRLLGVDE